MPSRTIYFCGICKREHINDFPDLRIELENNSRDDISGVHIESLIYKDVCVTCYDSIQQHIEHELESKDDDRWRE